MMSSVFKCKVKSLLSIIVLTAILSACDKVSEPQLSVEGLAPSVESTAEIIKSPNDRRSYRSLVLDNQLKVILISDPETDKSAAAVDVNSGSNSDPEAFEGLAHFLEHMLFLGTQKYPEAGEYQEFISSHGGGHNAYTAYENTSYFFDIENGFFDGALDRFSQFFIAPLFTPEYVDRERNAVHSEYQSNLQNDGRRAYQIMKEVINQAHPLSQFSVGSLETLQDKTEAFDGVEKTLREALLQHYQENYSANIMTVALLGTESLDELEAMAREYFSAVENRNVNAPRTSEPIFNEDELPALLEIYPVRDSRSLSYTFPIPVVKDYYKSKPLNYLGNVLGHEGEGSLLSLLKENSWVNGLSAGGGMSYDDNATFTISVSLTEEGVNKIDEISQLVFQFIELVKQEGIQEWLFTEQQTMAELSFMFQETSPAISYVGTLSRRLQYYSAEELITAAYAYEEFNTTILNEILAELRPDNVLLTFTSQAVETNQLEPLFGGQYSYTAIPEARISTWQSDVIDPALTIAEPNPFLPENLGIKSFVGTEQDASSTDKPNLLFDENGTKLWFKQDNEFLTPRANFYVYAMTPVFTESLENALLSSFVVSLVNDKLNEYSYPANLAGVFYGVSKRARGFSVRLGGYDDKQEVLLEELLKTIVEADFEEERFAIIKTEMIRGLENSDKQQPYVRLFQEAQALITNPYWSEEQRIEALGSINFEDVLAFVPSMLSNLKIEALYHGNVVEEDAYAMMDIVSQYLDSNENVPSPAFSTVLNMDDNTRVVQDIEVDHADSAIVMYMQGPDDTLQTRATVNLLASIISSPFYDTLRTEKQLGYIVNASTMRTLNVNGLVMYIESPNTDPLALENNIGDFLSSYEADLTEMSTVMFNDIKSGLLNNLRQDPQRMSSVSGRYWNDILIESYDEDSTLMMADAIETLSKEQVLAYYKAYVSNSEAGRLVARAVGEPHQAVFAENEVVDEDAIYLEESIESYQAFKESSELYIFNPGELNAL